MVGVSLVPRSINCRVSTIVNITIDPHRNREVACQCWDVVTDKVVVIGIARGSVKVASISIATALGKLDRSSCVDQIVPAVSIGILDIIKIVIEAVVNKQI